MAFFTQKSRYCSGVIEHLIWNTYTYFGERVTKLHTAVKYISKIVKWVIVSRGDVTPVI